MNIVLTLLDFGNFHFFWHSTVSLLNYTNKGFLTSPTNIKKHHKLWFGNFHFFWHIVWMFKKFTFFGFPRNFWVFKKILGIHILFFRETFGFSRNLWVLNTFLGFEENF